MRVTPLLLPLILCCTLSTGAEEQAVSLVPEDAMGMRRKVEFERIKWSAESPWLSKPAPVCRAVEKPLDIEPFKKVAVEYNVPVTEQWTDPDAGKPEEGGVYYSRWPAAHHTVIANPKNQFFKVIVEKYGDFERDEHQMAVVDPLPTKEECVEISRKWMKKLGIDEAEFARDGDWPGGFDVEPRIDYVSRIHPITKEKVVADFGYTLRFSQQIGGLSASWSGYGGNVMFKIAHGGKLCRIVGCLRPWVKIGDYEVLDKKEVEEAFRAGYTWTSWPFSCDQIEITNIELQAYHAGSDEGQTDFPLIYTFKCLIGGGAMDGRSVEVSMPALKQHRSQVSF